MTEYVILSFAPDQEGGAWVEARRIEARSGQSAIRAFVDGATPEVTRFVAVPARSFRPVTVKVETKTALRFS